MTFESPVTTDTTPVPAAAPPDPLAAMVAEESFDSFRLWINDLPEATLARMRSAILHEEEVRAERVRQEAARLAREEQDRAERVLREIEERFMNLLAHFESCFATAATYTLSNRFRKELFRTTFRNRLRAFAQVFTAYFDLPANQTPLGMLQFLAQNPESRNSLYVLLDGDNAETLVRNGPLKRYLQCFTLTDAGLALVSPRTRFYALDDNDAALEKHAHPDWLEKIRAADALFALSKVKGGVDALTNVYVHALQARQQNPTPSP